jgi:hypothetical protein
MLIHIISKERRRGEGRRGEEERGREGEKERRSEGAMERWSEDKS